MRPWRTASRPNWPARFLELLRERRDLHQELDEAVAAAYGWPAKAANDPDETNRRLLALNRAIVAGEVDYRPFE